MANISEVYITGHAVRGFDLEALKEFPQNQAPKEGKQLRLPIYYNSKSRGLEVYPINRAVDRENFGPGSAGDSAYNLVQHNATCERIINIEMDSSNRDFCRNEPTMTFDFDDWERDMHQIPVCSMECIEQIMEVIKDEKVMHGGYSINGFGRY